MASLRANGSLAAWLAFASCGAAGYSPWPVDVPTALPDDAFARCRALLMRRYGGLAVADEGAFLLQTGWAPTQDPPGERRASVFRDDRSERSLAVVVEFRWLTVPLVGTPRWTEPHGDAAAERELGEALLVALSDPEQEHTTAAR